VPSLFLLHDLGLFASKSMEFISIGLNYFLSDRKVIVYKPWGEVSQFRDFARSE
jgi:hypothetical protein